MRIQLHVHMCISCTCGVCLQHCFTLPRQFKEGERQTADKHMYTHSFWLIIREMQIKIRRRYHFCHNFGKNIKSQIWAPSRTAGRVEIWYNHITEQFSTSNKVNDACTLQSGNFTEVENLAACYIHLFH